MRNLKCVHHSRDGNSESLPCAATSWNTSSDSLIFALGPTKEHTVIELRKNLDCGDLEDEHSLSRESLIASWDALSPLLDLDVDRVVSLQYLAASETACLVLAGGDIVIVRLESLPEQDKIEIVGSVDIGITAAEWSSDQDLLAIATRADTLLFMTADFDNVANVTFSIDDVKLSKQVSVGWGKAETQFKGKRARTLRDPTVPERVDEGTLFAHDAGDVSISWRGDGAFVAVNSVVARSRRLIRVFSREGILSGVTEPVDGLTEALSWKPSGQLIAGIQRLDDGARVVFFERNGLRHGDFDLRLQDESALESVQHISLSWNIDSSVLAVCFRDRVQLWTMNNYHYYMKQEVICECSNDVVQPLSISWHPEEPLRFTLLEHQDSETAIKEDPLWYGAIRQLQYVNASTTGTVRPPCDIGNTAVLDGRMLRVTPLQQANVPPPMALHETVLTANAVDAAFNSDNTCLAVLLTKSVAVYGYDVKESVAPEPKLRTTITLPGSTAMVPSQICFGKDHDVYVLFYDLANELVQTYSLKAGAIIASTSPGMVNILRSAIDYTYLLLASDDVCYYVKTDASIVEPFQGVYHETKLPTMFVQGEACSVDNQQLVIFGLSSAGTLYADQRLLMRNCTSFVLTQSHLIATTTNHLLKFIHITGPDNLDVPQDQPEIDERCRNIERGARLVTVMPSSYAVVLQMPRGNLETIYPRALVLAGIRRAIEANNYREAFLACRSQRVDMNILHDHDPDRFLGQVEKIIKQLKKVEYIDLFLSQLSEADTSETLYKNTIPVGVNASNTQATSEAVAGNASAHAKPTVSQSGSKVNRICDVFLAVLKGRLSTNLQNVITASLCRSPPDIEAGLGVIIGLADTNEDLVDKAVEHICFLADVNKIYETTLGMYELDLALLIAQQSQKDPREYLPYLQKLQELEGARRSYQIDDDLGKHAKALEHLHGVAGTDEFLAYAEKHELYQEALRIAKYEQKQHDTILRAYAAYLSGRNRFRESAIAYESLNAYPEASEAYRSCTAWRESLACISLAIPVIDSDQIVELATSLADSLEESKDYFAAATIRLDYLNDIESGARTFCKGYHFAEAIRLVGRRGRKDLIEEVIDPGLGEGFATLSELLAECKGQLGAQVPRLKELRVIKARDPLAFLSGDAPTDPNAPNIDIPDNVSLAPSTTSTSASTLLTRYTNRTTSTLATGTSRKTSKNRKREERKRARGKKGSVYEEEYLVNSVGRLVERVNEVQGEVERCVECLCRRGMWGRAEALERSVKEVVASCERIVPEVWEIEKEPVSGNGGEGGAAGLRTGDPDLQDYRPMGAEGVLWDSLEEQRKGRKPPVVKPYTASPLLSS